MRSIYSTIGVFPVPPTARFPTQISGKLKIADLSIFLSKSKLRVFIIPPYKTENGSKRYLRLLNINSYYCLHGHKECQLATIVKMHIFYDALHKNLKVYQKH